MVPHGLDSQNGFMYLFEEDFPEDFSFVHLSTKSEHSLKFFTTLLQLLYPMRCRSQRILLTPRLSQRRNRDRNRRREEEAEEGMEKIRKDKKRRK